VGDQDPTPSLSRRTLLTGGIAALTATAAATLPIAEEGADALRPFNYPSGGHGDWWPGYVAHAGTSARPDRHYHYIRDQLIVAQDDLSGLRKGLRRHAGVEVGDSLDELGLALVRLQRPRASVPELVDELHQARDPAALWVGPNYVLGPCSHLHLSGSIPQPSGEQLAPPPAAGSRRGEGVAIALLDSGAFLDHPWFAHRVTGDTERADLDGLGRLHCNAGHGTFVAGVLLTHAPGARVEVHRVFDSNWIVDEFTMARRLRALASGDVQVLTMPFGGYSHDDLGMLATSAALRYLFDRRPDLVAVAGAGNDATNKPYFPAADRGVIAVGAVHRDGSGRWRRACFSNYGPWVDASAPGVNVLSTFLDYEGPMIPREVLAQCIGRLGGEDRMPSGKFTGWAHWSGTSFAAPMVAAAIAAAIGEGLSGPDAARHVLQARGAPRIDHLGTIVTPGILAPA
jgi:subtilase family protein